MDSETLDSLNLPDSSSSSGHWNRDVFLSYRVEDTHKNFTDHLYLALTRAGIPTFRYDRVLPVGHNLWSGLEKAIRKSRVSIVVFSKDYASSEWCLDELVKIVECKENWGQLIIPVFYDVDSNDVRKQSGAFADAFARHEECYVDEVAKVERWRLALREATKLPGWDLQNVANGYEAKFIQEIVRHVLEKVKITKVYVAKHPVGLEPRVKKLISLLKIGSDDVKIVGVYGMGGLGKSTIAKSFYNSTFHLFEDSCFLANVREVSLQPNGLARLQEQLLSQTLKGKKHKIANVHIGITFIKERLCYKKVLIVLDDVDQLSQLKALAGQRHWFGLGSRIIITTRNEHLLNQAKVDVKYAVKKLNDTESLRLFSWHAFKKPVPMVSYRKLSNKIASYTGGLPLALEVLGASLTGQTKKELWQSTLEKLRKIPPHKILEKLRISFETLDDDKVKDIFLDIACFFIGMDKDYAVDIFKGCNFFPGVGISILIDRCLLRVSSGNKLKMHDLVRDMGRKIVNEKFPYEPGKRSRIWLQEDVVDVLRRCKGSQAIEGLLLDLSGPMHFSTKAFERMHKLRLLQINNVHLDGHFKGLFEELRWLCWHHCPLDSLPDDFHPGKLVFLDMQHNNFNTLWQGTKFLGNLKILNINDSKYLTTTPDFSGFPNLEELSLVSCPNLSYVDRTIGVLGKLTNLNLGQCHKLKFLPSSICNLRSLQKLSLSFSKLEQLPEKLGDMKQLRDIDLTASAIKELPDSIGFLCSLNSLTLTSCNNLRSLPSSLCNVRSLERLYINECISLRCLPEDVGNIKCLRVLSASGTAVEQLPDSIGYLGELTGLHLKRCKNLRSLPSSICNLFSLEFFNLSFSLRVKLGESAQMWDKCLLNLTHLDLRDCNLSEQDIPHNLGEFSLLDFLCLGGNKFCSLPSSLGQLYNLSNLDLSACRNLLSVEVFPPNLTFLSLNDCSSLQKLSLPTLKDLSSMYLKNCGSLVDIQGLENLYLINEIRMEGCSSLSTAWTTSLIQGHFGLVHKCAIYFSRMEIPHWFEYQKTGNSSISFDVPIYFGCDQLDVTVWVDYSFGKLSCVKRRLRIHITNVTNDDELIYRLWGSSFDVGSWVRHLPPDYPIKGGDRIEICLEVDDMGVGEGENIRSINVEKYGVHIAKMQHSRQDFNLITQTKRGLNTNTVETNPGSKRCVIELD